MSGIKAAACMLEAIALLATLPARADGTNPPSRLAVTLTDGSLVLGAPEVRTLRCVSPYAELEIPLERIRAIRVEAERGKASLELTNGDHLAVVLDLDHLQLTTLFGEVSVPIGHIREIAVRTGDLSWDGLVLHYSFDKDCGSRIPDDSGNGHDGRVHAAKWAEEGKRGGIYVLDGTRAYLELPDTAKQRGPFTVSIWFTCQSTGDHAALYGGGGLDAAVDRNGIALTWAKQTGRLYLDVYDTPKRYSTWFDTTQIDFVDGAWHQAIATYDGQFLALYIDGEITQEGRKQIGSIKIDWTHAAHYVGRRAEHAGQTWSWEGKIDELMILGRALSSEDVEQLHAMGRRASTP